MHADGGSEVMVEGQEVWGDWVGGANSGGHRVEGRGQGAVESKGTSNSVEWMEEGNGARQGV